MSKGLGFNVFVSFYVAVLCARNLGYRDISYIRRITRPVDVKNFIELLAIVRRSDVRGFGPFGDTFYRDAEDYKDNLLYLYRDLAKNTNRWQKPDRVDGLIEEELDRLDRFGDTMRVVEILGPELAFSIPPWGYNGITIAEARLHSLTSAMCDTLLVGALTSNDRLASACVFLNTKLPVSAVIGDGCGGSTERLDRNIMIVKDPCHCDGMCALANEGRSFFAQSFDSWQYAHALLVYKNAGNCNCSVFGVVSKCTCAAGGLGVRAYENTDKVEQKVAELTYQVEELSLFEEVFGDSDVV